MDTVQLSRTELYELVWSIPMRTLAARYGLSDRGLAKLCQRHRIPVPPRGYWAKKSAGKRVVQLPLRSLPDALKSFEGITIHRSPPPENVSSLPSAQEVFERSPDNRIPVSDSLRSPHPLVRKTWETLKAAKAGSRDYLSVWPDRYLDVQVTKQTLPRALRLLDALVKAFEARGWSMSLGEKDDRKSYVLLLGQRIPFGIREKVKKVKNEPAKPVRSSSGQMYTPYQSVYRDEWTGRLVLVIRNSWGHSVHQSWEDTDAHPLEERLNEFVLGVFRCAEEEVEAARRREVYQREQQEIQRRRMEEVQRREREADRVRVLDEQAERWSKSQALAAYIDCVRKKIETEQGGIFPGSREEAWLKWAVSRQRQLDPLEQPVGKIVTSDEDEGL